MPKKKVAGSSMTLKDFHGGSIPSDLPLPSSPGVIPKITTDRPVFDRAPWGTSIGRVDQRTRPTSSHSIRNLDDKSLFLPYTANIGRNFNEDERKPLDGHSAPRRVVSDEVFRVAREVKGDSVLTGRNSGWSATAGPFPGKINDATHSVMGTGNIDNSVSGTHPNVWNGRKEVSVANNELGPSPWTTQPAVSNLAHSSALEQMSSGRWQSKLLGPSQMSFDVVKHSEIESRGYKTSSPVLSQWDEPHGIHIERGLVAADGTQGEKKFSRDREYEKIPGSTYLDVKEAKMVSNSSNKPHPINSDVRSGGHLVQPTIPSEVVGRPKLNLLPRRKPLESVDKPENGASNLLQRDTGYATQKSMNISLPGLSGDEIPKQRVERPKLNLKPVALLLEQPEVKTEKERSAVFGGARPRELVLKERGIDEIEHQKLEQSVHRMVLNPTERVPEHAIQRPMSTPLDLRTRKFDPKDGRTVGDSARSETQRKNWRENENKSSRQQHQTQEKTRYPSPETWRKPVPQKPESPDRTGGLLHGKAASALQLAQAYSPFSDPKSGIGSINSFNTSRNNQTQQQPFSRLVGSTTTPRHINGY